jgi:hypothetical protein
MRYTGGGEKVMEQTKEIVCSDIYEVSSLELGEVMAAEGLELGTVAFIISPLPCCAKAALPFWARVIGTVKNEERTEVYVRVTVEIMDKERRCGERYSDAMILDGLQMGEFDVKILEFRREARSYNLLIERVTDLSEF